MSATPFQSMCAAVADGNLDKVKQIAKEHPDLVPSNSKGEGKWNWMHLAARNGHPEVIRWLAQKGVSVNAKDGEEMHPLSYAIAEAASVEAVKALLACGARVNPRGEKLDLLYDVIKQPNVRRLPVSEALELAGLLIDHGCPVNDVDDWGKTPLSIAVLHGFPEIAFLLINRGANPHSEVNRQGLDAARQQGRGDVVQEVLAYAQSMTAKAVIADVDAIPAVRPLP